MVRTTLIAGLRGTQKEEWRNGGEGVGREGFQEWKRLEARPSGIILAPPVRTTLPNNLSRDSRRRCYKSHSTVTILVRSGRYNVAGQCLLFRPQCRMSRHIRRTSMATRGDCSSSCWSRNRSRLTETSFLMNVRTTTLLEYIGWYLPINSVVQNATRIKYVNVKMWLWSTRPGNDDKRSRRFFTRGKYSISCMPHITVIEINGSLKINSNHITMDTIITISIVNQNLKKLNTSRKLSLLICLIAINSSI